MSFPPPPRLQQELTASLARHDGVMHLQDLLAIGFERREVARMHRVGTLVRPRIGWYCDPSLDVRAVQALRVGGVLGCVDAAASFRLVVPTRTDHSLHVSLPADATRLRRSTDQTARARAGDEPWVRWHWQERHDPVRGFRVSPVDAILQMAACTTSSWLTAAIDSGICTLNPRPPLLSPADLRSISAGLPEHLREAVDRADALSQSAGETHARLGLIEAGIPFRLQVPIGGRYRGDILIEDWLLVEIDGSEHHSGPAAFASDRERDAVAALLGYRVLRFTHRQVLEQWPYVLSVIRSVLAEGRPRRVA